MTCKDCIHYEVCLNGICDEYFTEDTPQDLKVMFSPIGCETFKNKTDFVEVVRCKDCKFYDKEFTNFAGKHICSHFDKIVLDDNNDFCSYGERK